MLPKDSTDKENELDKEFLQDMRFINMQLRSVLILELVKGFLKKLLDRIPPQHIWF